MVAICLAFQMLLKVILRTAFKKKNSDVLYSKPMPLLKMEPLSFLA
jgi:hypothetical protein